MEKYPPDNGQLASGLPYQAAIAALQFSGIRPESRWEHEFVRGRFEGQLIYRRKLHSTEMRGVLAELHALRRTADYDDRDVSYLDTERAMRRARLFVRTIQESMNR